VGLEAPHWCNGDAPTCSMAAFRYERSGSFSAAVGRCDLLMVASAARTTRAPVSLVRDLDGMASAAWSRSRSDGCS
jgi:hypothetical protein